MNNIPAALIFGGGNPFTNEQIEILKRLADRYDISKTLSFISDESFTVSNSTSLKSWDGILEYKCGIGDWTIWDGTSSIESDSLFDKQVVSFRGKDNTAFAADLDDDEYLNFSLTGNDIELSGSLKYLFDYESDVMSLEKEYTLFGLFAGCSNITSIPDGLLPFESISAGCYMSMFQDCSGLTSLPDNLLPATALANSCYDNMFSGCTGLTEIPENLLPATTLAYACYVSMFSGCTGLTEIPENLLPATTLADACYIDMFENCTGLTKLPENLLPATTLAVACYTMMFGSCENLETLPTNLLHATELADECYVSMFNGCTNLLISNEQSDIYNAKVVEFGDVVESQVEEMFYGVPNVEATPTSDSVYYSMNEQYERLNNTLTFYADNEFTVGNANNVTDFCDGVLEVKSGNGEWEEWDGSEPISASTGAVDGKYTVSFRGTGNTYMYKSGSEYLNFVLTGNDIALFGSCNNLLEYAEKITTLPTPSVSDARTFSNMFQGCTGLTTLPSGLLPATTLARNCYNGMFRECTGLTNVPNLPADTLAAGCYSNMFYGCTGLTSIPSNLLPATTLVEYCYNSMFRECTGFTTLPSGLLPADTLDEYCYQYMFQDCTGLISIPTGLLPATTLASNCYQYMFRGCTGLITLPSELLPADTLAVQCYNSMFRDCTGLTTLPSGLLPAATLASNCYNGMFQDCTSLQLSNTQSTTYNKKVVQFGTISPTSAVSYMFQNVPNVTASPTKNQAVYSAA